jgi:hypothetical protein
LNLGKRDDRLSHPSSGRRAGDLDPHARTVHRGPDLTRRGARDLLYPQRGGLSAQRRGLRAARQYRGTDIHHGSWQGCGSLLILQLYPHHDDLNAEQALDSILGRCEECTGPIEPRRYEGGGPAVALLCSVECWIAQHQREAGPRSCAWPDEQARSRHERDHRIPYKGHGSDHRDREGPLKRPATNK